jgi:hypothetical protein
LPLPANEAPDPGKPAKPTLKDILALQTRLDDLKSSDLPDDQKMAETHKLKIAIAGAWQQLRDREAPDDVAAPDEADEPDPNDPSELYFQGWLLCRDAEKLAEKQKPEEALEKLDRARQLFDRVARGFPDWKPEMVAGRRQQTAERLAFLSRQNIAPEQR